MDTNTKNDIHETREPETPVTVNDNNVVAEGKTVAVISYITFIGLIIAFIINNDKKNSFAQYHIRQSLGIILTGIALGILNIIPILGQIINIIGFIMLLYMLIVGIINAVKGQQKPLPILGNKYEEWFKSI